MMGKPMEVQNFLCNCQNIQIVLFMVHLFSEMFVLQFSKVEKASTEQVDAAHKQFMAALASLYLKHNTDETISLVIT